MIALADVKTEDLIAGMSDEQKTALSAALAPPAPGASAKGGKNGNGAQPGNDPEDPDAEGGGDGDEDDKKMKKAKAAGVAEGQKAAAARVAAVAASEHFDGREKAAMKLLGSEKFVNASAEDVIGLLAELPKGAEGDAGMLDALRARHNPNLGTETDQASAEAAKANNHGWADIHAEVRARRGL
ncbi:MAG TPA: hypothetical protein VFW19_10635 [Allosphingosinicella sp.]|nr:hypothetical protein [Allosphingosinicella sp.]